MREGTRIGSSNRMSNKTDLFSSRTSALPTNIGRSYNSYNRLEDSISRAFVNYQIAEENERIANNNKSKANNELKIQIENMGFVYSDFINNADFLQRRYKNIDSITIINVLAMSNNDTDVADSKLSTGEY